jgi:hypothetical protein
MEKKSNEKQTATRPKDKSFEAYKAWVKDLVERFTTSKHELDLTEKEWRESWQEYWKEKSRITL